MLKVISFGKGDYVGRILRGEQTQTRRVYRCSRPYYMRGDWICCKEQYDGIFDGVNGTYTIKYRSDGSRKTMNIKDIPLCDNGKSLDFANRNFCCNRAGFMPQWASRCTIVMEAIRSNEWLRDISPSDIIAEGFKKKDEFIEAWDMSNGKRTLWEDNPRVYVYTFRVLDSSNIIPCVEREEPLPTTGWTYTIETM